MKRLLTLPKSLVATIMVLISIVSVQMVASFSVKLYPVVGAMGTTALRQIFAAIILCVIFKPWQAMPERKYWRDLAIYGVILGVMNLTFYLALARLPQGIAVAIEFLGPLSVAILASRRWLDAVWVGCAVIGMIVLLPIHQAGQGVDPAGFIWAILAAAMWAVYIIIGQRISHTVNAGKAVAIGMVISTIVILPFGVFEAGTKLLEPHILLMGLVVSILASAIPYGFEMVALKHIPAKTFSLMMSLEPVFAALMGMLILQQHLTWLQGVAIVLIIIASSGSSLTTKAVADHP
jgi:inner membrane transporter RhtA